MKKDDFLKLVAAIVICEFAGIIGSAFTFSSIPTWYAGLVKPALNPPAWIFGPVWTTLYLLMGVAAFLIWKKSLKHEQNKRALMIFGIQLGLNALWSIVFFGMHNPGLAILVIVLLWLSIIWSVVSFFRISRIAAYLLIPYILWVSFAAYLNYSLWALN